MSGRLQEREGAQQVIAAALAGPVVLPDTAAAEVDTESFGVLHGLSWLVAGSLGRPQDRGRGGSGACPLMRAAQS